jgi:hypothetical protein
MTAGDSRTFTAIRPSVGKEGKKKGPATEIADP